MSGQPDYDQVIAEVKAMNRADQLAAKAGAPRPVFFGDLQPGDRFRRMHDTEAVPWTITGRQAVSASDGHGGRIPMVQLIGQDDEGNAMSDFGATYLPCVVYGGATSPDNQEPT